MSIEIRYSRDAQDTLRQLDAVLAKRLRAKIWQLAEAPEALANNIRALKGGEGLMRLRVGDWRVIYRDDIVLMIVRIAARGSAYD